MCKKSFQFNFSNRPSLPSGVHDRLSAPRRELQRPSAPELTQFVGLDLEIAVVHHFHEAMQVIGQILTEIFRALRNHHAEDIAQARSVPL